MATGDTLLTGEKTGGWKSNASLVGDCPISADSSKLFLLLWWKCTDDIMMNLQMVNIPVYCSQDMKIMLFKIWRSGNW